MTTRHVYVNNTLYISNVLLHLVFFPLTDANRNMMFPIQALSPLFCVLIKGTFAKYFCTVVPVLSRNRGLQTMFSSTYSSFPDCNSVLCELPCVTPIFICYALPLFLQPCTHATNSSWIYSIFSHRVRVATDIKDKQCSALTRRQEFKCNADLERGWDHVDLFI